VRDYIFVTESPFHMEVVAKKQASAEEAAKAVRWAIRNCRWETRREATGDDLLLQARTPNGEASITLVVKADGLITTLCNEFEIQGGEDHDEA
jgi:hypothetical protein